MLGNKYAWKGDKVGKLGIHVWLMTKYGKPKICEDRNCEGKSNVYNWCLIKDKEYKRRRNHFIKMCVACHRRYDYTEEKREKQRKIATLQWGKTKEERTETARRIAMLRWQKC